MGIGTGLGAIIARRFTGDRDRSLRIAIGLGYLIAALGLVMMANLANFGVLLIGTALRGIGGGIGWVFATQLLFQIVPDRVRGRVFSTEFAFFALMSAAGSAAGGWLLDNSSLGISGMIWLMAVLVLVPAVLWLLWNTVWKPAGPSIREDAEAPSTAATLETFRDV